MAGVLFAIGLLFLLVAAHPFTTYPLSLWLLRVVRGARVRDERDVSSVSGVSICMCAYNEESVIVAKIENLLALRRSRPDQVTEILVYVDGASDRTVDLLRPYEAEIRLLVSDARQGKTFGMNRLVALATQPILVFTDANVTIDERALEGLPAYFAAPDVGCVSGYLQYTNGDASATARSGSLYWRLEQLIKRLEGETGSAIGADGSLFAIRRELHRPPPDDIIDDMYVSLSILCEGYRVVQGTDFGAYESSATHQREEFQRKVRIACQAFNVHLLLWDKIRCQGLLEVYKYVSHKLLRWLTIYSLALGVVLLEAGLFVASLPEYALGLAFAALACALLGYFSLVPLFTQLWDILVAFAGAGLGVLKSLGGERYRTWTPPQSSRS